MNHLIHIAECGSTNDEILSFLSPGFPDILGLYTFNQTNGRGQYGNIWKNTENENLAFSIAVKSSFFSSGVFINFRTAGLLRNFVANLTDEDTKIKWPNDIILNQKKISGILIEKKKVSGEEYFIIGIGLNINQIDFKGLPKAGSLHTQTNRSYNIEDVAKELFALFEKEIFRELPIQEALEEYNQHLFRKDVISVFEKNGTRQNGIIQNVDEDGFLWIEMENEGLQRFFHKEVEMLY
ncbi:MAG: biotin--[acetyl-CoA-carboxylase] ligase [Bergeyella sp.]